MSVDKFGRRSNGRKRVLRGPKGDGFAVTAEGDYDIKGKRLVNVNDGQSDGDAVNLKVLSETCIRRDVDGQFDAVGARITNVHQPLEDLDAVNLGTLRTSSLYIQQGNERIDANGHVLGNLGRPSKKTDAATKGYVDGKLPTRTDTGVDFGNVKLTRVGDPTDPFDAVNLQYLEGFTVSHRYLHQMLAELSFALYLLLKNDGRINSVVGREWWLKTVSEAKPPFTFWHDLFKYEVPGEKLAEGYNGS